MGNIAQKLDQIISSKVSHIDNTNDGPGPKFPGMIRPITPSSIPPVRVLPSQTDYEDVTSSAAAAAEGADPYTVTTPPTARTDGPSTSKYAQSTVRKEIEQQIQSYYGPDAMAYVQSKSVVPNGFSGQPEYIFPGICMSDIARDTGLTIGGVSRIFNGKRKPMRHTLVSIANLYTDGDVEKVKEIIRTRVAKQIRTGDARVRNQKPMSPTTRNKVLGRIS